MFETFKKDLIQQSCAIKIKEEEGHVSKKQRISFGSSKKKYTGKELNYLRNLSFDTLLKRGQQFELEGTPYIEFHMDDVRDLPFMNPLTK